jgi:hypothetical protein
MSTFSIPNGQGQIRQVTRGDIFGELWGTFNLDLTTSPGKIKVSKRLKKALSNSGLSSGDIVAITVHDGNFYAATTANVYVCSNADPTQSGNWSVIATLGLEDLGFETDMVSFGNLLLISLGTDIMSWNESTDTKDDDWWTATVTGTALTVDKPHTMHVHRGGQETVFVTDGNKVRYYNATAGHSTVTLDALFTANCIASGVEATWVGTYTENGESAYVYEIYVGEQIDSVPVARNAYKVDGRAVLSIDVIDNVPYIVTERGSIQAFNGAGFTTVASFPFAYKTAELDGVRAGLVQDTSISRPIHPKGMRAFNRSLYIALNSKDDNTVLPIDERSPSGIWEYNADTGELNHRYSLTESTNEYGEQVQLRSSPLLIPDSQYTRILAGGEVYDGTSTGLGLWVEDMTTTPQGYFITPEITSQTIQDTYEKVILKAKTLQGSESIVVKYRTSKNPDFPQYNDITWLNSTQFTTTDATGANIEVGNEIEIVAGHRAGHVAHVTAVSGTITFTVTIDESIGTLNEVAKIRVQNWIKLSPEYLTADGEWKAIGVGKTSPWIQYKVLLSGDIEFRQFISKGNSKTEL